MIQRFITACGTTGLLLCEIPAAAAQPSILTPARCSQPLRVSFFGDVYVGQGRYRDDLLSGTQNLLTWADANIVNLENVISFDTQRAYPDMPYALRGSSALPPLLSKMGIRWVTRANNHAMDFGEQGRTDTDKALQAADIQWTGTGKNLDEALEPLGIRLTREGKPLPTLGIVAFSTIFPKDSWAGNDKPGVPFASDTTVKTHIEKIRESYDFVIASFHWGHERTLTLRPYQPILAEFALKAGADAVVGHHAHVAQGIDLSQNRVIAYGLGNYVFTTATNRENLSLAMHIELCAGKPPAVAFTPLNSRGDVKHWNVTPHSLSSFRRAIQPLVDAKAISGDTAFYLPDVDATRPLKEWLKHEQTKNTTPPPARTGS